MSEHRRKPPNSGRTGGGGRRRAAPSRGFGWRGGQEAGDPGGRASRRAATGSGMPTGGRRRAPAAGNRSGGYGGYGGGGGGGGPRRGYGGDGPDGPRPRRRRPMPPPKKRFIDYPRSNHEGLRRWVPSWKQVLGLCVLGAGLLVGLVGIGLYMVGVPDLAAAAKAQNNVYYWDDGTQMASTGSSTNRQIIPLSKIPKHMQYAIISAENATFYQDSGVDPKGITRAIFNMAKGGETQSGSTITQQYVKNAMLQDSSQTLTRKVKELFISVKVGATVSKSDILKGYLNTAYYGRGAYGIQAAAQAYFGVDAEDLEPDQSALLAAVLKGPNLYDPRGGEGPSATPQKNRARSEARWKWILDRETKVEIDDRPAMSMAERAKYTKFPKVKAYTPGAGLTGEKGYLVDVANKNIMNTAGITKQQLEQGGYQIHTTFNKKKVTQLKKAVDDARKKHINPKKRSRDRFVEFGGASVDPRSGQIKAIYGGRGFEHGSFYNMADPNGVPVGSTWKPFVLASAMEYGTYKSDGQGISPQSKYKANNNLIIRGHDGKPIPGADGKPFRQVNEGTCCSYPITLQKAMILSINSPFVQLGIDTGLSNVAKVAQDAGIRKETMGNTKIASFAIGTATPSSIRMASAYGTFAASGKHVEPYSVKKVERNGEELDGFAKHTKAQAMDANVANNVTKVLRHVVDDQDGTGHAAAALGRPAAGKTGTTDSNASAWFVGYTPQLSTAISMFRPTPTSLDPDSKKKYDKSEKTKDFPNLLSMNGVAGQTSIHGGAIPTEVWTNYMRQALEGQPTMQFPEATPIGDKVDGTGVPSPKPTPTPSETMPTEPPDRPTDRPTKPGHNTPTQSCNPWDPNCQQDGGTTDGGTGGSDGGIPLPSTSPSQTGGGGNGNGGRNGGLFG